MSNFYLGKTVVVTGGCGLVGVQLVKHLLAAGARVGVLDNLIRGTNKLEHDNVEYQVADAGNGYDLGRFLKSDGQPVFAVFNLAAIVAGVSYNVAHHHSMFESNVRLQTAPVTAAEAWGVPHFLQVSSVCVYDPDQNHPCQEENGELGRPHPANAGYSWAKRVGEQAIRWSRLPHAVTVRPSNIFGPHDYFDEKAHVIPSLIKKILAPGDELVMHSPSDTTREFICSEDVALGMMCALEHGGHKKVYNIGTNGETAVTLAELVAMIQSLAGTNKKVVWQGGQESGDPARWSDASKLNKLGWQHEIDLVEGLEATIEWYKTTPT